MRKSFLLLAILTIAFAAQAQVKCKRSFFGQGNFYDLPTTALKWSPIVTQGFNAKAFTLEQRIGKRYSVSLSLISHDGFQQESNVAFADVKPHQAIELNHRLYPVAPMKHAYLQVGTSINSDRNWALNVGLGAQEYIMKHIPVDLTVGVQTTNSTVYYYSDLMFRASIAIGFSN